MTWPGRKLFVGNLGRLGHRMQDHFSRAKGRLGDFEQVSWLILRHPVDLLIPQAMTAPITDRDVSEEYGETQRKHSQKL